MHFSEIPHGLTLSALEALRFAASAAWAFLALLLKNQSLCLELIISTSA